MVERLRVALPARRDDRGRPRGRPRGARVHARRRGAAPPPRRAGRRAARVRCSRSAATAASRRCTWAPRPAGRAAVLFSVDHHRGSEENQPGGSTTTPRCVDPASGRIDTLPALPAHARGGRAWRTSSSPWWARRPASRALATPLALLFIDGGHAEAAAQADYAGFAATPARRRAAAIHDVFPDPADGGQAPFHVYERALDDGFGEVAVQGSLRVLSR